MSLAIHPIRLRPRLPRLAEADKLLLAELARRDEIEANAPTVGERAELERLNGRDAYSADMARALAILGPRCPHCGHELSGGICLNCNGGAA